MKLTAAHTQSNRPNFLLAASALWIALAAATIAPATDVYLELEANGLEDLGAGWAYEGWLIVAGTPVSTSIPFSIHQSHTFFSFSYPLLCPSKVGNKRCLAQRRFPSIIMAI